MHASATESESAGPTVHVSSTQTSVPPTKVARVSVQPPWPFAQTIICGMSPLCAADRRMKTENVTDCPAGTGLKTGELRKPRTPMLAAAVGVSCSHGAAVLKTDA